MISKIIRILIGLLGAALGTAIYIALVGILPGVFSGINDYKYIITIGVALVFGIIFYAIAPLMLSKVKEGVKLLDKEISKYPTIKKDLAIIIDKDITSKEAADVLKRAAGKLLTEIEVFDVYTGKGIEENKKSIAYSLSFGAKDRTLTDEEINAVLEKIIEAAKTKLNAELRG